MEIELYYPRDRKLSVIYWIIIAFIAVIISALWYLQIIQGDKYRDMSRNNRIRRIVVSAPRGSVYDRNGVLLVDNRPSFDVELIPNEIKDLNKTAQLLSGILAVTKKSIVKKTKLSGYIPYLPVVVARDITIDKVTVLEEQKPSISGVYVQTRAIRNYIYNDYASHLIGYVGSITLEEYKRLKDKGYMPQDIIGKSGIEKTFDSELMGVPGGMQIQVNNKGLKDKVLSSRDPVKGSDIFLTIDRGLQDILETEMNGKTGAAVVMDPQNGEILAMVSKPGFNPNIFLASKAGMEISKILRNSRRPLINRVINGTYSPGSIFKIIVAAAALETKTLAAGTRNYCPGYFMLGQKKFNCWREFGHGTLDVVEALKYSCNVFFYKTGVLLGSAEISNYARKFMLGEKTGIQQTPERRGTVPDAVWKRKTLSEPWVGGDTVNFAIGQGYMLVTPIQIVSALAAVANGGIFYRPLIVKKIARQTGEEAVFLPYVRGDLNVSPENLAVVRKGLFKVVNDPDGTGYKAFVDGIGVCGKTGTVQYGSKGNERNHALFAGYAPDKNPQLCMAVLVESAESGGLDAAPIAQKIFEAYAKIKQGEEQGSGGKGQDIQ